MNKSAVLILDVKKFYLLTWKFRGSKITAHVKLSNGEEMNIALEEEVKGHVYRFTLPGMFHFCLNSA